jgi:hypothetical protein
MMDKVSPLKRLAANFSGALFACFDFLTFEDGADGMCLNVSNEVPMKYHSVLHYVLEEQRSHMIIWQCRPWFGTTWSISERSDSALYTQI